MKIGIGMDTGGTYTDVVAYDFESDKLLAKGKALTTREDLTIGIKNAFDSLPPELIRDAEVISLSTTLATNACVENKGGRAKLLIFGLTDELLIRYKAEQKYGFKRENVRCIDMVGSADGLVIDEPDWDEVMRDLEPWLEDIDALAIAELYSMSNGAPCEKHARKLIEDRLGLSCIGASELSSDLDVIARGATALLNARLLPIGREFIEAVLSDLTRRGYNAPVMVVRSDGSLMSAEHTLERPVETILSGPAASVLAGKAVSDASDYLIIDMGGTTTDVSVVRGGMPTLSNGGINIGGWRTHVKGVFIDTFALGGDSAVRAYGDTIRLFPRRSMPICVAARRWPKVKIMLEELFDKPRKSQFPVHEFFYLVRKPSNPTRYNKFELRLMDALKNGPRLIGDLAEAAIIDLYHLDDSERLEDEGIIMRCGLTPTDFMHIKGDFTEYDTDASILVARFLLLALERDDTPENIAALANEVYDRVSGYMYEQLLRVLLAQQYPKQFAEKLDPQTEYLINEAWAKHRDSNPVFFNHMFTTSAALVGVGAPTHIFLPAVAKALGTECILPEHAEVANAFGALKANIATTVRVEVSQRLSSEGEIFYITHAPTGSRSFDNVDDALELALAEAESAAIKEVRARGATGQLTINTRIEGRTAMSRCGSNVKTGRAAVAEVTAPL